MWALVRDDVTGRRDSPRRAATHRERPAEPRGLQPSPDHAADPAARGTSARVRRRRTRCGDLGAGRRRAR
jgi:hypothetical protein